MRPEAATSVKKKGEVKKVPELIRSSDLYTCLTFSVEERGGE